MLHNCECGKYDNYLTEKACILQDTVSVGIAACAISAQTRSIVAAHCLVAHITLPALPTYIRTLQRNYHFY
jgi:hypothetical protein